MHYTLESLYVASSFSQSEGCCDYLTVYESNPLGSLVPGARSSGYKDPGFDGFLTSSGPTMYLTWTSDSSVVYQGWKVRNN